MEEGMLKVYFAKGIDNYKLAAAMNTNFITLITFLFQGIVNTRSANIFTQAAFSAPVFTLAMSVIEMFEDGELKGQKEIRESKILSTYCTWGTQVHNGIYITIYQHFATQHA